MVEQGLRFVEFVQYRLRHLIVNQRLYGCDCVRICCPPAQLEHRAALNAAHGLQPATVGYVGGLGGPGGLGSQTRHNQEQTRWLELCDKPALQQAFQPLQTVLGEGFGVFNKIDKLRIKTEMQQLALAQFIDKFLPLKLRKGRSAKQAGKLCQSNTPV